MSGSIHAILEQNDGGDIYVSSLLKGGQLAKKVRPLVWLVFFGRLSANAVYGAPQTSHTPCLLHCACVFENFDLHSLNFAPVCRSPAPPPLSLTRPAPLRGAVLKFQPPTQLFFVPCLHDRTVSKR